MFTLLGDLLLDLCDSPEARPRVLSIGHSKNAPHTVGVPTHVVSCPIASNRDWLRSLSLFPFNPP